MNIDLSTSGASLTGMSTINKALAGNGASGMRTERGGLELRIYPIANGFVVQRGYYGEQHYCADLAAVGAMAISLTAAHVMDQTARVEQDQRGEHQMDAMRYAMSAFGIKPLRPEMFVTIGGT